MRHRLLLIVICCFYVTLAAVFALEPFDIDEFGFITEPYELFGGDYTVGYLHDGDYADALRTAVKSYYFFWKYRPINAPIVSPPDRALFSDEEKRYGYVKPISSHATISTFSSSEATGFESSYAARLIVPEPDRFYSHGAGKPLLPALLSVPQLVLVETSGLGRTALLRAQFRGTPSAVFLLCRAIQYLSGVASLILLYNIVRRAAGVHKALMVTFIFSIFPLTIKYFPNMHHDSIMVTFFLLTLYLLVIERFAAAGVAYGLALASKNVAIILAPALLIQIAINAIGISREAGKSKALVYVRSQTTGLLITALIAFATLIPFANPLSYAEEVMTPIVARPIDTRGEEVKKWTVNEMTNNNDSQLSPSVLAAQKFLYFHDIGFFFAALALFGLGPQLRSYHAQLAMAVLCLYIPLSAIFSPLLDYRTLLLAPLFLMIASDTFDLRRLRWLALLTMALTFAYLSNPMKTDLIHQQLETTDGAGSN
jgi:hypothetical protein